MRFVLLGGQRWLGVWRAFCNTCIEGKGDRVFFELLECCAWKGGMWNIDDICQIYKGVSYALQLQRRSELQDVLPISQ